MVEIFSYQVELVSNIASGDWTAAWGSFTQVVRTTREGILELFDNLVLDLIRFIVGADFYDAGEAMIKNLRDGIVDRMTELRDEFRRKLQELKDMLTWSEPKDPASPLRNLGRSGEAIVGNIQEGIDRAQLTIGGAVGPAFQNGLNGAQAANGPVTIYQTFEGIGTEPGRIMNETEGGLLAGLRAAGMA